MPGTRFSWAESFLRSRNTKIMNLDSRTARHAAVRPRAASGMRIVACALCAFGLGARTAAAQAGDIAGEPQPAAPASSNLPVPQPLAADAQRATFVLPACLSIELVASEPLIEAPVQAVFDEDGRLWVVEMRGYMRDIDGAGEREPTGRVSILYDDDGDGRMDRASRFLEGLVLPRSVAPTRGGALVIAPPKVIFARDTDGDGHADEITDVDAGISGIVSPEYGPNGLLWTLDGAFQSANHDLRYRFQNGQWAKERTCGGGQWGITRDDLGRIFYNNNSDFLRADFVCSRDRARNDALDPGPLVNARVATDQSTFPAHPTPGVNRAYREGWLLDGRLRRSDAACGPWILRGDALGEQYRGNAFVCEPAGNLVKRFVLEHKDDLVLEAHGAWKDRDFLTSTDERFRPVNLTDGPDGALYVVDMYRGILQHRTFVTTYLRRQVEARRLDGPDDRGRIWRIAPAGWSRPATVALSGLSTAELLKRLESPNGWLRDTAQRLFVEGEWDRASSNPKLVQIATGATSPLARIHALWVLAGSGAIDAAVAVKLLQDSSIDVRHEALRACEPLLDLREPGILELYLQAAMDRNARLSQRAFASLSGHADPAEYVGSAARNAALAENRRAVLSGLSGNHAHFLQALVGTLWLPDHASLDGGDGRAELARELMTCLVREGRGQDLEIVFGSMLAQAREKPWFLLALIDGALAARPKGPRASPGYVRLARAPDAALVLRADPNADVSSRAEKLLEMLVWPGRADAPAEALVRPLTAAETARVERGRAVYAEVCASCHLPSGRGEPGKAPPLRDSSWVLGDPAIAARLVLAGLEGPLHINGREWNLSMPAWNGPDADIAAVLSYLRREWGHGAEPVEPEVVSGARSALAGRSKPFAPAELQGVADELAASARPESGLDGAALFDGRTLAGWRSIGDARFEVQDGGINGRVGGGAQSFLATERTFGDFVLELDVKLFDQGNSGIQVRSNQDAVGRVRGWQIEIDPSARAWSGGLYDEGRRGWLANLEGNEPARKAFDGAGWNHFRIECIGVRVRTWLNGVPAVDHLDPADLEGFLALQVHSGNNTNLVWKDLRFADLGRRAWEPLFCREDWEKSSSSSARKLAAPFPVTDTSVRVRGTGRGFQILVRANPDLKRGVDVRTLAPGVSVSENGYWIDAAHLELQKPPPEGDPLEIAVTLLGDRLAVHGNGTLIVDTHAAGPERGELILIGDPDLPFQLESGVILGPAKR